MTTENASPIIPNEEEKDKLLERTKHKKTKKKANQVKVVVKRLVRNDNFRPIMFSRNTAMFTIPSTVRDNAKLLDLYEQGLGALVTFNEKTSRIEIEVGVERPKPHRI